MIIAGIPEQNELHLLNSIEGLTRDEIQKVADDFGFKHFEVEEWKTIEPRKGKIKSYDYVIRY